MTLAFQACGACGAVIRAEGNGFGINSEEKHRQWHRDLNELLRLLKDMSAPKLPPCPNCGKTISIELHPELGSLAICHACKWDELSGAPKRERSLHVIDHRKCLPTAHDWDARGVEDQRQEPSGLRLCNDCGAQCFYCTNDEWYHHSGKDVPPCFLVKDQSWDVPVVVPVKSTSEVVPPSKAIRDVPKNLFIVIWNGARRKLDESNVKSVINAFGLQVDAHVDDARHLLTTPMTGEEAWVWYHKHARPWQVEEMKRDGDEGQADSAPEEPGSEEADQPEPGDDQAS